MKLYIRNMVCDRCVYVIESILRDMHIQADSIKLGELVLDNQAMSQSELETFRLKIESLGFELINDRKSRLIESIKKHILILVQQTTEDRVNLSGYLSSNLHHDYNYLSHLFSTVEGVTIEQYLIHQKIEKVKELLVYDEITLTEISLRMGYSSVAHLSRQFKKVTGQTPSKFKNLRDAGQRKSLDKV